MCLPPPHVFIDLLFAPDKTSDLMFSALTLAISA
jgi:hypothetical protein